MSQMDILLYKSGDDAPLWVDEMTRALPGARVRVWTEGDHAAADYALVWRPIAQVLAARDRLKAVFNLGAGVDVVLDILRAHPGLLPSHVPVIKLDDAGMAPQMIQYVLHAVLRHFRRFNAYATLQHERRWQPLAGVEPASHTVGVMGLGALGAPVAIALAQLGFQVRGWSRSSRAVEQVTSYAGYEELPRFLDGLNVVVNMLPLTAETENILDRKLFSHLAHGAQVINIARGAHLVEEDLLQALDSGQIATATLDVFRQEPLPPEHPFWADSRIEITPHISALTLRNASVRQISEKIARLEQGLPVDGVIDLARGY